MGIEEYSREDESDKKPKGWVPHKDFQENVNFFNKQMSRVNWLPNENECPVYYEISDKSTEYIYNPSKEKNEAITSIKEYKCVTFMFPKGKEKVTTVVSFHQPSRKTQTEPGFKEQLCDVLNYFGAQGWLEHKTRNSDGITKGSKYEKPAPNKWDELFGR